VPERRPFITEPMQAYSMAEDGMAEIGMGNDTKGEYHGACRI